MLSSDSTTTDRLSAEQATTVVRRRLEHAAGALRAQGIPVPAMRGKLMRPVLAYAFAPAEGREGLGDRFWLGALAIQMVHEASLLHDDILDGATERRGGATVFAAAGVGPALVLGDHYLTGAYRAALSVGSSDFLSRFIVAVERTVAGEVRQGSTVGEVIDLAQYFDAILGKSGELIGLAACLEASLTSADRADEVASLGRQVGALYQQIDDLLDFCDQSATGKDSLQDYRQRKWTWVLEVADVRGFDLSEAEIRQAVFGRDQRGISAAERALLSLDLRREGLQDAAARLLPVDDLFGSILEGWLEAARDAVRVQVDALARSSRARRTPGTSVSGRPPTSEAVVVAAARDVGGAGAVGQILRRQLPDVQSGRAPVPSERAAFGRGSLRVLSVHRRPRRRAA